MDRKRLKKERKKIDVIDQQMFNLIKKRTIIVKKMLTLKKYKHEIVDHKRIKEILLKLRRKSILNNIDPKMTQISFQIGAAGLPEAIPKISQKMDSNK